MVNPATLADTSSRLPAPRLRSACCVGATMENGTDWRFSSRFRAVTCTVTSSVNCGVSPPSGCCSCCAAAGCGRTSMAAANIHAAARASAAIRIIALRS